MYGGRRVGQTARTVGAHIRLGGVGAAIERRSTKTMLCIAIILEGIDPSAMDH
jgi:hypothetical protein